MPKNYSINEISKMFNIPKSTLRYWEKHGVINIQRNNENSYRCYTRENILEICTLCVYKNLDLSLQEIKNTTTMNLEELETLFSKTQKVVYKKLEELNNISESIDAKLQNIHELKVIQSSDFKFQTPPFKKITSFHPSDKEYIDNFLKNQKLLSFVSDFKTKKINFYGIADFTSSNLNNNETILWKFKKESRFLQCIVRVNEKSELDLDYSKKYFDYIASLNKSPKFLIAQYLVSYFDTEPYDYYKSWIQID